MFGLAAIVAFIIYLIISILIVLSAVHFAKSTDRSPNRWGWGAAIVMYTLVFLDWIPTVLSHRYYCSKEGGFWIYKTAEQWAAENPGVMETLTYNKNRSPTTTSHGNGSKLNERFVWIFQYEGPIAINIWRIEQEILDTKTDEIIAREVRFSTSQIRRQAGWSGWKVWLDSERCSVERHRDQGSFSKILKQFKGAMQ